MINGGITGMGGGSPYRKIKLDHIESNNERWVNKSLMSINQNPEYPAFVTAHNKIYILGGTISAFVASKATLCFDPLTETTITKADMPSARKQLSAAEINGLIYAVGGNSYETTETRNGLKTNECYDTMTNTWTVKANMPTQKYSKFSATFSFGRLYVIYMVSATKVSTECYDPITNTWATKADMPTLRFGFYTAAIGEKIYAIGGIYDNTTQHTGLNQCYDVWTNTWSNKANLPRTTVVLSMTTYQNKIYFSLDTDRSMYLYDPKTNSYSQIADIANPFSNALLSVNGQLCSIRSNNLEYYDPGTARTLQILGVAEMSFDKQVKWNNELKPANIKFTTTSRGVLSLIENDTSGMIKERTKSITINIL